MKQHLAALILISALFCAACNKEPAKTTAEPSRAAMSADRSAVPPPVTLPDLTPQGEKNMLPGGGWFTWKFSEKPKLGAVIVKVQVFDKDGKQGTPYTITGDSGMPEMPAHDANGVIFQLNKKGDYLMPVNIVMTGEWRVIIKVKTDKTEIYAGKAIFSL